MPSDLWTLAPSDTGAKRPLADYGFEDFELVRVNQDAATLSLMFSAETAASVDLSLFAYDRRFTFFRGDEIVFRGRVADAPDVSEMEEGCGGAVPLRDAWADLATTPYLQNWVTLDASGTKIVKHPRALLGWQGTPDDRETTTQALSKVIAAANAYGTPITLIASLPPVVCPTIEAANQSCAELIRAILRYHPGAIATVVSGSGGDLLYVYDASRAIAARLPAEGAPTTRLKIKSRPDLARTSVHVYYSTAATHWTEGPAESDETPGLVARQRLTIFSEAYPPGAAICRRALVVELPAGQIEAPPPPAVPHSVAIATRKLPATGAYDASAEKFWLDQLGLTKLGLTKNDVRLPRSTAGAVQAHKVEFFWAEDDADDPLGESALSAMRPESINPSSTPLWRPPSVDALPRYLVSGSIAEWMRVRAAEVVVSCSVGVSKSAVDDLGPLEREIFFKLGPTTGDVLGWPAYFVRRDIKLLATTAKTKVYRNWAATASYDPAADLQASIEKARDAAVVPNLARDLWQERSVVPWQGTVSIVEEECGAARFLSHWVLCIDGGRPEWETMRAVIQSETLRGFTGATVISFGPPAHLAPQDYAALYTAARLARTERAAAAISAPQATDDDGAEEGWDQAGHGAVFSPAIGPVREVLFQDGGKTPKLWDIEITGTNKVKLRNPGRVRKSSDVDSTALVTITGVDTEHTLAAGKYIALKLNDAGAVSVVLESTWDGHPFPIVSEPDAGEFLIWQHTYFPLWKAISPPAEFIAGRHVTVSETITLERLAPDADLEIVEAHEETPSGKFVDCDTLVPGWGAAGA